MLAHAGQKAPALRNEKLDPRYTPKADYNSGYTPGNSNYDSNYYQGQVYAPTQRNNASTYPTCPSSADYRVPPGLAISSGTNEAGDRTRRGYNQWRSAGTPDKRGYRNAQRFDHRRQEQDRSPQHGNEKGGSRWQAHQVPDQARPQQQDQADRGRNNNNYQGRNQQGYINNYRQGQSYREKFRQPPQTARYPTPTPMKSHAVAAGQEPSCGREVIAENPPLDPPPFLLVGDAEARRYAEIPDLSNWMEWCDFEEEHPEMDFTFDHLADYQQMASAVTWVACGVLSRWVSKGAILRPQYAALLR